MTLPLVTALDVLKELDRIYPLDELINEVRKVERYESLVTPGPLVVRWLYAVDRMRDIFMEAKE